MAAALGETDTVGSVGHYLCKKLVTVTKMLVANIKKMVQHC